MKYLRIVENNLTLYIDLKNLKSYHTRSFLKSDIENDELLLSMVKTSNQLFRSKRYILDWSLEHLNEIMMFFFQHAAGSEEINRVDIVDKS